MCVAEAPVIDPRPRGRVCWKTLTDALLYAHGPVKSLVDLTLTAEHRRATAPCTTR